ncbi:MAG: glutamine--tRNA ligase/YqeY domain fusion protein [SAR202 cluster bacterium]|mgnify:FL=1|nr:glutamine--tRNA ligase/YqeY domain fusion protein [SAR202 cluster bacterium]|tara:strand:- start:60 stop:1736 length:1677 start_codon:yes stop_codon:yes gene_type:complete
MNETNTEDFIREIIRSDVEKGLSEVVTRFPPEPNGYLHIGHATSICLNFGIAEEIEYAKCNLRFDDTNPVKETTEFIESIKKDIQWLGFEWGDTEFYASNYFQQLYSHAITLIKLKKAYVDSQTQNEIRVNRGTLTEPGKDSPYRNRSIDENIDLLERMKKGEYEEGAHVLRAKIDMGSPNMNMRDPVMYRIIKTQHHQTGEDWSIYPMYDFAHGLSDSIEKVTHSLCTMEYVDHRPLYDWFINELNVFPSRQIEFGKVLMSHTILSKRNLLKLVEMKYVDGWDDPRMPTISGMRRLGFTPNSIKDFCKRVGITKRENVVDIALLEHCVREDLNKKAERRMAVINPLKVTIENYPQDQTEYLIAQNNPQDESFGTREIPFSKELYIEKEDFMENPSKKFKRLSIGEEVRLRYAYFIKCEAVIKDELTGEPVELICTYDPKTKGGSAPDNRKPKGTIHWVSSKHSIQSEVRLYDRLCSDPNPDISDDSNLENVLNPNSLEIKKNAQLEPSLKESDSTIKYQFERLGYFCLDNKSSNSNTLVFNRTVSLRDSWSKANKGG